MSGGLKKSIDLGLRAYKLSTPLPAEKTKWDVKFYKVTVDKGSLQVSTQGTCRSLHKVRGFIFGI